jgi:hypothetical protein
LNDPLRIRVLRDALHDVPQHRPQPLGHRVDPVLLVRLLEADRVRKQHFAEGCLHGRLSEAQVVLQLHQLNDHRLVLQDHGRVSLALLQVLAIPQPRPMLGVLADDFRDFAGFTRISGSAMSRHARAVVLARDSMGIFAV